MTQNGKPTLPANNTSLSIKKGRELTPPVIIKSDPLSEVGCKECLQVCHTHHTLLHT
jgi:hypothetical protein